MAKKNESRAIEPRGGEFRSLGTRSVEPRGTFVIRDAKTGRFVEVRGANSMPSSSLAIKKGVDLTKPIARQVLRGVVSSEPKGKAH